MRCPCEDKEHLGIKRELFNGVLIGCEKKGNDSYILNYLNIAEQVLWG